MTENQKKLNKLEGNFQDRHTTDNWREEKSSNFISEIKLEDPVCIKQEFDFDFESCVAHCVSEVKEFPSTSKNDEELRESKRNPSLKVRITKYLRYSKSHIY